MASDAPDLLQSQYQSWEERADSRGMGYDAFISYSHAADARLAPALQTALHRFAKPWWKLRAINVFRDETSLSAAHDLSGSLRSALEEARFFILLASPGSAQSKWVGRQVKFWLERKSVENILIVLTEGHIAWDEPASDFDWSITDALPRALAGRFTAEPLWVDLAWAHSAQHLSSRDPRFQQAIARLAAPLHGKSLDEIAGEEVRQHKKTRRLVLLCHRTRRMFRARVRAQNGQRGSSRASATASWR